MAKQGRTGSFRSSKGERRKGASSASKQRTMKVYEGQTKERRLKEEEALLRATPAELALAELHALAAAEADAGVDDEQASRRRYHRQVAAERVKELAIPKLGEKGASFLASLRAEVLLPSARPATGSS